MFVQTTCILSNKVNSKVKYGNLTCNKKHPATQKNTCPRHPSLNINLDSADDGQNWETVIFLVTPLNDIDRLKNTT